MYELFILNIHIINMHAYVVAHGYRNYAPLQSNRFAPQYRQTRAHGREHEGLRELSNPTDTVPALHRYKEMQHYFACTGTHALVRD
jgi:hypothetical protein